jgi:5-methylcytosine-specific restriction endonuclease McrA
VIVKSCEICGSQFSVKPYRASTARFCSQQCGGKWHMQSRSMPNEHKIGNQWRKGLRPANAFTPEQARTMNIVVGEHHTCRNCGSVFELKPWLARQNQSKSGERFCSKKCHSDVMARERAGPASPQWVGGITTYRGKGWLIQRALAIERDRGTCQACGKLVGESIPVHHVRPFRLFSTVAEANALTNLICLCQPCHMKVENASTAEPDA